MANTPWTAPDDVDSVEDDDVFLAVRTIDGVDTPVNIPGGLLKGGMAIYPTRAAAVAATIPASVDAIRTNGFAGPGDSGDALYKRVEADPDIGAGGFQSVDGAWWRYVVNGPLLIEQFGGRADCVITGGLYGAISGTPTDNLAPFNDMMKAAASASLAINYSVISQCIFGAGIYYFSDLLEPRAMVIMQGQGGGSDSAIGTIFRFPANKGGITLNRTNTGGGRMLAGTEDDPFLGSAYGTTLRDLYFLGGGGGTAMAHGLWMRATGKVIRCTFDRFAGNNINIVAHSNGGDTTQGNANGWWLERITCRCNDVINFAAIYVEGSDANAGTAIGVQVKDAKGAGIIDADTLGNTYVGLEIDGYGAASSSTGNCYHDGVLYTLATIDTTLGASTEPGTNESVWYPVGTAGAATTHYPEWSADDDYSPGAPMYIVGSSNCTAVLGGYSEGGVSFSTLSAGQVHGGQWTWSRKSNQLFVGVGDLGNQILSRGGIGSFRNWAGHPNAAALGTQSWASFGMMSGLDYYILSHQDEAIGRYVYQYDQAHGNFVYLKNGLGTGNPAIYLATTPATTFKFGRSAAVANVFYPNQLAIGDPNDTTAARIIGASSAAPTSGEHARGEIVINNNPSSGSALGWRCTTGGTPGIWETIADPGAAPAYPIPQVIGMSAVAVSHTGDTTETTLATITIPGGLLGANGAVEVTAAFSVPNNANNKSIKVRLGGTTFSSGGYTTSASVQTFTRIANRNSTASQVGFPATQGYGLSSGAMVTSSADTTVDQDITITGQLANAADTITLESYVVRVITKT